MRAGLKKFLAAAHEGNDYTLIAFNEKPRLIARSVSADEVWQKVCHLKPEGQTALYDAVRLGLNLLEELRQRHKAVVLFSDGQDNSSHAGLAEVQQAALNHRATIYTVGILAQQHNLYPFERNGLELLNQLAASTGGVSHFPAPDEIGKVLEKINADVRSQYSLSYYPPDKTPGWRRVQVKIQQDLRQHNLRYQQRYLIR